MPNFKATTEAVTSVNARRGAGHNAPNEAVKAEVAPPAANATAVYHITSIPEKYSTPITISNKEFIEGVFHDLGPEAHAYYTSFPEPPEDANPGVWMGAPITARLLRGSRFTRPENNNFKVVSSFHADAEGRVRRRKDQFAAAHTVCIDDLGRGMSAKISWDRVKLEPSYVIETSPDNCQAGMILKTRCEDQDQYNRVVDALVHQGLAAENDPGMKSISRYMRAPVGTNSKKKYGTPHRHVCRAWNPELRYTLEDIIRAYDLVLGPPKPAQKFTASVKLTAADDPYLQVLSDLGLVLTGEIKSGGDFSMIDVRCIWAHTHTDRIDQGAVYIVGGGTLVCHHGHCIGKRSREFRETLREKYGVNTDALDAELRLARHAIARQTGTENLAALFGTGAGQ
jgi:hypothetical protein